MRFDTIGDGCPIVPRVTELEADPLRVVVDVKHKPVAIDDVVRTHQHVGLNALLGRESIELGRIGIDFGGDGWLAEIADGKEGARYVPSVHLGPGRKAIEPKPVPSRKVDNG